MGAPLQKRSLGGIIVREIIQRNIYIQTLAHVAVILVAQGIAVILGMSHDEEASAVPGHAEQDPRLRRLRQDLELLAGMDGLGRDLCIAAVGDQEIIVKAADNRLLAVTHFVGIYTEQFFVQQISPSKVRFFSVLNE